MSTTIDSKVVEMRFDNQQFEHGVNQSISSIDRLKSALSFNGIKSGVGTITTSINSFGIIAKRVLENVADVAFNTGTRLVKSLSVDNIATGWAKYEEITRSTQTIMAATKTNWIQSTDAFKQYAEEVDKFNKQEAERKKNNKKLNKAEYEEQKQRLQEQKENLISLTKDQRAQMEFVNKQLEKLNWYTDETSYNLTDMTSNIGKFTAAGIGLEDATNAMMGVASWAAISGANVQQASRAMYNLSQAMGMGELKLQDWMSIENANMATLEFKTTALETAASLGKLKKNADGTFSLIGKKGKETIITAENFRASLSKKWFDKDVITATLKVYGDFANDLYKYTEKTGLTATQLLKYTDQVKKGMLDVNDSVKMANLGKELGLDKEQLEALTEGLKDMSSAAKDLGFNAFRAGQEARTLTDAINYVKDAVSTGWMNTFKTIFGDYLNATELWTEVAEEFYDLFVLDVERQNDALKKWADAGGREQLLWGIKKLWRSIKAIFSTIKTTFNEVFPPATGELLYKASVRFHNAMNNIEKGSKPLTQRIRYILLPLFRGFKNILESIINVAKAVGNAFKRIFNVSDINILEDATKLFEKLTNSFKITEERGKKLERFFTGFFAILDIVKMAIQEILKAFLGVGDTASDVSDSVLDVAASFGDWVTSVRDWLKENKSFKKLAQWVANFVKELPGKIDKIWTSLTGMDFKSWCDKLIKEDLPKIAKWVGENLPGIREDLEKTGKAVDTVSGGVGKIISYGKDIGVLSGTTGELNNSLQGLAQYIREVGESAKKTLKPPQSAKEWGEFFKNISSWIKIIFYLLIALKFWDKIQSYTKPLKQVKQGVVDVLEAWKVNMNLDAMMKVIDALKSITTMIVVLSILPKDKMVTAAGILGAFLAAMGLFFVGIAKIKADPAQLKAITAMVHSVSVAITIILASLMVLSYMTQNNMPAVISAAVVLAGMLNVLVFVLNQLAKINIKDEQLLGISASLFLLTTAMLGIGAAIMLATSHGDWKSIGAAGFALATVLIAMCAALKIMPKNNDIAGAAAALLVMSAALVLVSVSLALVSKIEDPAKLLAGAAALALVMSAVAGALFIMSKASDGATLVQASAAMLVASVGIIALALALRVVSEVVSSGNAVGAILLLAGALAALVIAALLCSNPAVQAALYAIGAACALIGVGALAAGGGLVLFASAVERLAKVGPDGVILLVEAMRQIALVMPEVAVKVAESIVALLDSFVKSRDKLVQALSGLITILFDVLIQTTPKLFEFLGTLIQNVCVLIIEKAPIIAQAITTVTLESLKMLRTIIPELTSTLFTIIVDTLTKIRDNIEDIIKLSVEIGILTITGFIKGITEQIPNLVSTGWEFILALINGIADGVDKYSKEIRAAMEKLAKALVNGFCTILGIKSPSKVFDGFGINIVQGIINGITGMAKKAWETISGLATELINKFKDGFKDITDKAGEIMGKVVDKISGVKDKMKELGSNIINALKKGMEDAKKKIGDAAGAVADTITGTIKKIFKIKSPSRVFMEIGKFLDEGLAIGLENNAYKAVNATEDVAKTMTDAISSIADMVGVDTDLEPVIKPVLDLSDVTTGVDQMNSMFAANRSIKLASSSSGYINGSITAQQQTNSMLDTLRTTLSNLGSDGGTVNNNTFNITGDNPKAIADEVSRILQTKVERRDAVWGT